jgi:hypothetical protein
MGDEDELIRFRKEALRRSGVDDVAALRRAPAVRALPQDLAAVLRLRLGLDREPARPRSRAGVAEALGLGGTRVGEMVAALEEDVLAALGPRSAIDA